MLITNGEPETKEDFEVLRLYPDTKIAELAHILGLASSRHEADFPLRIRQWAVFVISPRGEDTSTLKNMRDQLNALAKTLQPAVDALYGLPTEARWRLATTLGFPPDDDPLAVARADDFISEVTNALGSLSAAAQRGALEIKISRGPREKAELKEAAYRLGHLYQELTQPRPTMPYNGKEGRRTGTFKKFADAALKPLFRRSSFDGVLAEVCTHFGPKNRN
jgi:hypothetical protein